MNTDTLSSAIPNYILRLLSVKKTTDAQKSWQLALYQHDEKDNIEVSFHRH